MPLVDAIPAGTRTIHILGIGGTAMAALAGMLVEDGFTVTGSDGARIYPPMSDVLARLGIVPMEGYQAENLAHRPDLVVVGNVVRSSYPEAAALLASDLPYLSFPALLGAAYLQHRHSIVVAGTHGKTTTTALTAWLLESAGQNPGYLVGGVARNFTHTARRGAGPHFVIEGDEYDTAFFDKGPKFLHYRPRTAIITSVEFDHADIYTDMEHYRSAFRRLVSIVPADGALVLRWDHDEVARLADGAAARVLRYGPGQDWDGRIEGVDHQTGRMRFAVLHEGRLFGQFESILVGEHNLWNQVAACAALSVSGLDGAALASGFRTFEGIKRRQEVLGEPGGVTVVDDFAHHPTAVRLTLEALRLRFGGRRLWAIFEPRSNTSRRKVFQDEYGAAFDAADQVVLAPPGDLDRIAPEERFDIQALAQAIRSRGRDAWVWGAGPEGAALAAPAVADAIVAHLLPHVAPEDVVAILSNGGFGGLHQKLLQALGSGSPPR